MHAHIDLFWVKSLTIKAEENPRRLKISISTGAENYHLSLFSSDDDLATWDLFRAIERGVRRELDNEGNEIQLTEMSSDSNLC